MSTENRARLRATVIVEFNENTSTYEDPSAAAVAALHQQEATDDLHMYYFERLSHPDVAITSVTVEEAGR